LTKYRKELVLILIVVTAVQCFHARTVPLSGDEVGVGVMQATGKSVGYDQITLAPVIALPVLKERLTVTPDHGIASTFVSLEQWGMQPPLYLLVMRGWIRLFGSGTLTMRWLSILFSFCSLIVLYLLAVRIGGRRLGIAAAICFGFSFYYLHLGIYVRPYAMAMLLSLLSILFWDRLLADPENLRRPRYFWGYALTVIGGLYTIYHFAFVFVAEGLLLVCKYVKNREQLSRILLLFLIVGVACLPWMGTLWHHVDDVSGTPYYFYGDVHAGRLVHLFAASNFTAGIPFFQDWPLRLVTGTGIVLIAAAGLLGLMIARETRWLGFLVTVYFLVYYSAERILDMDTLGAEKFLFFLMPAGFLLFSHGCSSLFRGRIYPIAVGVFALLLTANSFLLPRTSWGFDSGDIWMVFRDQIANHTNPGDRGLLIINTSTRRFLMPAAHLLEGDWDVRVWENDRGVAENLQVLDEILRESYDVVLLADFFVSYEEGTPLATATRKGMVQYLNEKDFGLRDERGFDDIQTHFYLFRKQRVPGYQIIETM